MSTPLASIPSVAPGTLPGTLVVRSTRVAAHARVVPARLRRSRRG